MMNCEEVVEGDDVNFHSTCKLAPNYSFTGHPLLVVYYCHLEIAEERK